VNVYVFTGPTLPPDLARRELDAIYLPPVAQGDVYRAVRAGASVIGIIDGYFERVPAVWHKEILWALSDGIRVFGSASMGALRAAELVDFGMEGVGAIFENYRAGVLGDDDEVAIAHGQLDAGFRPLSEALVNIRATLAAAEAEGIIGPDTRTLLEGIGKATFYPRRTYRGLLQAGAEQGLPAAELAGFGEWLARGEVNQKRMDAVAMLRRIRDELRSGSDSRPRIDFHFETTVFWEHARAEAGEMVRDSAGEFMTVSAEAVVEELHLSTAGYADFLEGALLRQLLLRAASSLEIQPSPGELLDTAQAFHRRHGLRTKADVDLWLLDNNLDQGRLRHLVEDEARVSAVRANAEMLVMGVFLDHLRVTGDYPRIVERAVHKRRTLEAQGLLNTSPDDLGVSFEQVVEWYFTEAHRREVPADLSEYAKSSGFRSLPAFKRALLREWAFNHLVQAEHSGLKATQ
jgi:hypothetical protein